MGGGNRANSERTLLPPPIAAGGALFKSHSSVQHTLSSLIFFYPGGRRGIKRKEEEEASDAKSCIPMRRGPTEGRDPSFPFLLFDLRRFPLKKGRQKIRESLASTHLRKRPSEEGEREKKGEEKTFPAVAQFVTLSGRSLHRRRKNFAPKSLLRRRQRKAL